MALIRKIRSIRHPKDFIYPVYENQKLKQKAENKGHTIRSNVIAAFSTWQNYFKFMK